MSWLNSFFNWYRTSDEQCDTTRIRIQNGANFLIRITLAMNFYHNLWWSPPTWAYCEVVKDSGILSMGPPTDTRSSCTFYRKIRVYNTVKVLFVANYALKIIISKSSVAKFSFFRRLRLRLLLQINKLKKFTYRYSAVFINRYRSKKI